MSELISSNLHRFGVGAVVLTLALVLGWLFHGEIDEVRTLNQDQAEFRRRVVELTDRDRGGGSWQPDQLPASSSRDADYPKRFPDPIVRQFKRFNLSTSNLPRKLPEFSLRSLDGSSISLERLRGQWTLLNFWASWCSICQTESPTLQNLHRLFKDRNLRILGVNIQQNPETVHTYVSRKGLQYPIVLDRDGRLANRLFVTGVPETILVDPKGRVVGRFLSYRDWNSEGLRDLLTELLNGDFSA